MSGRRSVWLWSLVLMLAPMGAIAAQEARPGQTAKPDYDENAKPAKLPPLPPGMTIGTIRAGDSLFRGKGGCVSCHGSEAEGLPASGSSLRGGLHFIPYEWAAIDSLVTQGLSEPTTRTPIMMPPRGAQSNLTPDEIRKVSAYVWAISQVRGEPWSGGHQQHE